MILRTTLPIAFLAAAVLLAQAPPPRPPAETSPSVKDDKPIVTNHSIQLNGKTLSYTATTGMLPIKTDDGNTQAHMFYIAYTVEQPKGSAPRPLIFSFNGGPGSASVWLHMGCLGPKRVKLNDDGSLPAPPYHLVDNDSTWLDLADMVFIDPVGTGYSRAVKPEDGKKYFGLQGDISSVGEFIRLYLTRSGRWTSPLFLAGESYGTTRAAGLSGYLIEQGIAFNGIILLSTVLNFETLRFAKGNDLPYALYLPSYTATAWYHKKLPPDLQADLHEALKESEKWALSGYAEALAKGDMLSPAERNAAIDKLARFTGLSKTYVADSNLRVELQHFLKELLRDRGIIVGRLDGRLTGRDARNAESTIEFDPSLTTIRPPYTALFGQYVRAELGYESDATYFILGGGFNSWDWGTNNGYADTSDSLREAFAKNPHMKLFIGYGYFDMATPYLAAQYNLSHAGFPEPARKNITGKYYDAGHMFYINVPSLRQLRKDIGEFIHGSIQ